MVPVEVVTGYGFSPRTGSGSDTGLLYRDRGDREGAGAVAEGTCCDQVVEGLWTVDMARKFGRGSWDTGVGGKVVGMMEFEVA
jgi:hypothetical protein